MGIWVKTGSSTWTKMASTFIKTGLTSWSEILSVWIKTGSSTWTKIFDKPNIPTTITLPFINDYLDTNRINNTTYISNVGDTLYGRRGSWNYSPTSYQYKWQYSNLEDGIYQDFSPAQTSTAHPSPLNTLVAWDDRWVRYAVKATNAIGSSDWILSSNAAHLVKYPPVNTAISITGSADVGSTLTATSTWQSTSLVSGDTSPNSYSYSWTYGDTDEVAYNNSDSQTYLLTSEDLGHTLKVKITATNTGGSVDATSAATAIVGASLSISGVSFTDANDRSGKDYNGNLVTAAGLTLNFSVSGVSAATSFRVRYRILNNQTQLYYNPGNTTTTYNSTQSAAWEVYTDNPDGTGNMSSVSTVGSVSTVTDSFTINEFFNGSTYSGGLPRWSFEYEISVLNTGGERKYWNPGNYLTTSQSNDFWPIAPASSPTITSNVNSAAKNTAITFSGTLASYPVGLNSYPSSYKIDYGDGTDSGWVATNGTANPTYSQNKSYSADGSYTATIETTPYYTSNSKTVTIADVPTKPTSLTSAVDTGKIVLTFSGGTGSQYDIFWSSSDSRPADGNVADFSNAISPFDASASAPAGLGLTARNANRYFWVRKSTGTVRSAWFPGTTTGATGGVVARLPLLAPWTPTSPATSGITETNITFSWAASAAADSTHDAVSGYEYYTTTSTTAPIDSTAATGSTNSSTTTKSFSYTASTSPSTQYFYVRAINSDAKSPWTAAVSAKPTAQVLYTVSFSVNGGGGTAPSSITQTSTGGSITLPGVGSMTAPSGKPNFGGWVTTTGGTSALTSPYTPSAATTLYALWLAPANTAPSGGSVTVSGTAKMRETLTATVTNASGYPEPTFTYQWQANNGGTGGNTYANISGATSSTYVPGGFQAGYNVRVVVTFSNGVGTNQVANSAGTAVIEAINWTVSYNANGGTGAPASTTIIQDRTGNVSSTAPTRAGYTFSGWATSATGTVSYSSGAAITPSANVELFAIWAVVNASVSSIAGSTGGRTGTSTWNDPKSSFTITFASTTSATARIQRSASNDFSTTGQFTNGTTETLTIASNKATITTNQPTGSTSTSANFYYRVQVISMNGTTLATPISSSSIQNTVTPKSNVAVYP